MPYVEGANMNIAKMLGENVQKFGEYEQLIYIVSENKAVLTNVEIENRARALATGLKNLGVTKGDIVGVCVSNISEIPEIMNGIMRVGATFLPIIFALTPSEIRYILEDSKAKILITEEKFWTKVKEAITGIGQREKIIVIGNVKQSDIIQYEELLKESDERGGLEDVSKYDLAILMYTSGTTGAPKGVMLTHNNLISSMKQGAEVWPSDHYDRILITVPMNHIYGVLFYHESCAFGPSIVLIPWFDAEMVLSLITEYRITVAPLVPTMITMMMEKYDPCRHNLESLKYMISAGAPLAEETWREVKRKLNIELYHGYGLTEAGPTVARQYPKRVFKYGSVGPPIPGLEVKIVDDNGDELSQGKEGEVICKGPGIMKGYWNKPKETAAALKDGWLYTGDLGRFDEDRELYITGRKKDLIIRGGENIDPGISENWLYKHPSVLEAAVVGIPDRKYGEEVAAAVVLKQDQKVTEEELLKYMEQHVHRFFAPKRIFILDALPKTSSGKILKREIRNYLGKETN
jgi:acyl-CoA synthetase (AMP-forming)/AMP-acid ligase II